MSNSNDAPETARIPSSSLPEMAGITCVDHVAIAVRPGELEAQVAAYRLLGFTEIHREEVGGDDQVREVLLRIGDGPNLIQLLEPTSPDSPVQKLIDRNGGRGGFAHIAAFCAWARTNQVRVLATFPNLCDRPEYHQPPAQKSARIIRDTYVRLGVPVVGDYTDALLPSTQFYDTIYHLTTESARARSERLARQLAPYLGDGRRQLPN